MHDNQLYFVYPIPTSVPSITRSSLSSCIPKSPLGHIMAVLFFAYTLMICCLTFIENNSALESGQEPRETPKTDWRTGDLATSHKRHGKQRGQPARSYYATSKHRKQPGSGIADDSAIQQLLGRGYVLEFGDCTHSYIEKYAAGEPMKDVRECAALCDSLSECQLFLWTVVAVDDDANPGRYGNTTVCLPKKKACAKKRQNEGDPNYMLFIKQKANAELQKQPLFNPPPIASYRIDGYELELGDCWGFDVSDPRVDQDVKTAADCAKQCNSLPSCKAFLWQGSDYYNRSTEGTCLPKYWACPRERQGAGDPANMFYIKRNAYKALQIQGPWKPQTLSDLGVRGYQLELGDCRGFEIAKISRLDDIKTSAECASLCNKLPACKAFVWISSAYYDKTRGGSCSPKYWACPPNREHAGDRQYMLYLKQDAYKALQLQGPWKPQPLSELEIDGFTLEYGYCGGDIFMFGDNEAAGKAMRHVSDCAATCRREPRCKLFVWLQPSFYDKRRDGICLPQANVCSKPRPHEQDKDFMLYVPLSQASLHQTMPLGGQHQPLGPNPAARQILGLGNPGHAASVAQGRPNADLQHQLSLAVASPAAALIAASSSSQGLPLSKPNQSEKQEQRAPAANVHAVQIDGVKEVAAKTDVDMRA